MTLDPFKPPAGWDRDPLPAKEEGPWTIGRVLRAMWRAVRQRPLAVLLAVCVLPGLWMVPANLAHDHFVPQDEPAFAPGRSLAAVAVSIGTNAWNSVWFSGHFSVSIAAVRLQPIPWRAYLTGLVRAPLMFLSVVLVALPFDLIGLLPVRALPGEMPWAFDALGSVLMIYLVARTCLWAPLLVEGRRPFFECLKESWMTTRGAVTRLVLLGTILVIATLPIAFVEASLSNHWHVTLAVISAHFVMAVATVYTFAYPQPATGEAPVIESSSLEP